jgi:ketosteroid isomerase-like protein
VEEREKLKLTERIMAAWNRGHLEDIVAVVTPDFEWDMTRSGIPGLAQIYRGRDGYLEWAESWRETMGPTQVEIEEMKVLADGRVYGLMRQAGTAPQSGVDVEVEYVQLFEFKDGKLSRAGTYLDRDEARRAAGLA